MQKPKNLLPGLFLCVFSRTAEPLVDFYCSNFWIFLFLFGADFFCRKERCFRPILYRPFLYRPILRADSTKNARAHHTFTARLYLACRRAQKAPIQKSRKGERTPTQKTPGVIPGVWLMKSSFNLLLTHCGRFLAGCTGPACSRRPQ